MDTATIVSCITRTPETIVLTTNMDGVAHVLCHYEVRDDSFVMFLPKCNDPWEDGGDCKSRKERYVSALSRNGSFEDLSCDIFERYADAFDESHAYMCANSSFDVRWFAIVASVASEVANHSNFKIVNDHKDEVTRGSLWMPLNSKHAMDELEGNTDAEILRATMHVATKDMNESKGTTLWWGAQLVNVCSYILLFCFFIAFAMILSDEAYSIMHAATTVK